MTKPATEPAAGRDAPAHQKRDNADPMEDGTRRLRADAERNRRRLLEAASEMFSERGLDVGVAEIAQRAGVGRGTLFRHFPAKEDLIAAIVVERVQASIERGRAMLGAPDPGEALFALLDQAIMQSESDRALFDALDDAWLSNEEIAGAHGELMEVIDALLARAQSAGAVRADVGAVDILVMVKGVCQARSSFPNLDDDFLARQLDLVRAAICAPGTERPLRGEAQTVREFEQRHLAGARSQAAAAPPSALSG
jgi:AcrR family transcriptional regulator